MNLLRIITLSLIVLLTACRTGSPDIDLAASESNPTPPSCDASTNTESNSDNNVSYKHLIGAVHEHSGFSDGEIGTSPQSYYEAGRDLGLNFMLGSEHSDGQVLPLTFDENCVSDRIAECLILPSEDNPGGSTTKWAFTKDLAANTSTETFTAVRGFEWTSDRFGHANIFFSENQLDAKGSDGYAASMEGLWLWFTTSAETAGGDDGLLVFNHPGREDAIHSNIPDPAFTFNDFEYRAEAADRVVGIEMFGKGSDAYDVQNDAPTEGWYARALDRGWKVAPTGSEDEHGTEWAKPIRAKTVILSEENSLEDLKEAMLQRRFYALAQHHSAIRLSFTADGHVMGSDYSPPDGTLVQITGAVAEAFPTDGKLEIVSNNGQIIHSASSSNINTTVAVVAEERWYYMRLLNADNFPVAYSAPIWLKAGQDSPICDNQ